MGNYLVVRREYDDNDDVIDTHPEMRITSVPPDTPIKQMKEILTQSGHSYQWGLYTVLLEEDWYPRKEMMDFAEVEERAKRLTFYEIGMEIISYDDLLDRLNEEKRVTLRLPVGLHFALSRAAEDVTLNAFCIKTLANAVGYTDLHEFELQRRKPGRPKKVQDSE